MSQSSATGYVVSSPLPAVGGGNRGGDTTSSPTSPTSPCPIAPASSSIDQEIEAYEQKIRNLRHDNSMQRQKITRLEGSLNSLFEGAELEEENFTNIVLRRLRDIREEKERLQAHLKTQEGKRAHEERRLASIQAQRELLVKSLKVEEVNIQSRLMHQISLVKQQRLRLEAKVHSEVLSSEDLELELHQFRQLLDARHQNHGQQNTSTTTPRQNSLAPSPTAADGGGSDHHVSMSDSSPIVGVLDGHSVSSEQQQRPPPLVNLGASTNTTTTTTTATTPTAAATSFVGTDTTMGNLLKAEIARVRVLQRETQERTVNAQRKREELEERLFNFLTRRGGGGSSSLPFHVDPFGTPGRNESAMFGGGGGSRFTIGALDVMGGGSYPGGGGGGGGGGNSSCASIVATPRSGTIGQVSRSQSLWSTTASQAAATGGGGQTGSIFHPHGGPSSSYNNVSYRPSSTCNTPVHTHTSLAQSANSSFHGIRGVGGGGGVSSSSNVAPQGGSDSVLNLLRLSQQQQQHQQQQWSSSGGGMVGSGGAISPPPPTAGFGSSPAVILQPPLPFYHHQQQPHRLSGGNIVDGEVSAGGGRRRSESYSSSSYHQYQPPTTPGGRAEGNSNVMVAPSPQRASYSSSRTPSNAHPGGNYSDRRSHSQSRGGGGDSHHTTTTTTSTRQTPIRTTEPTRIVNAPTPTSTTAASSSFHPPTGNSFSVSLANSAIQLQSTPRGGGGTAPAAPAATTTLLPVVTATANGSHRNSSYSNNGGGGGGERSGSVSTGTRGGRQSPASGLHGGGSSGYYPPQLGGSYGNTFGGSAPASVTTRRSSCSAVVRPTTHLIAEFHEQQERLHQQFNHAHALSIGSDLNQLGDGEEGGGISVDSISTPLRRNRATSISIVSTAATTTGAAAASNASPSNAAALSDTIDAQRGSNNTTPLSPLDGGDGESSSRSFVTQNSNRASFPSSSMLHQPVARGGGGGLPTAQMRTLQDDRTPDASGLFGGTLDGSNVIPPPHPIAEGGGEEEEEDDIDSAIVMVPMGIEESILSMTSPTTTE